MFQPAIGDVVWMPGGELAVVGVRYPSDDENDPEVGVCLTKNLCGGAYYCGPDGMGVSGGPFPAIKVREMRRLPCKVTVMCWHFGEDGRATWGAGKGRKFEHDAPAWTYEPKGAPDA